MKDDIRTQIGRLLREEGLQAIRQHHQFLGAVDMTESKVHKTGAALRMILAQTVEDVERLNAARIFPPGEPTHVSISLETLREIVAALGEPPRLVVPAGTVPLDIPVAPGEIIEFENDLIFRANRGSVFAVTTLREKYPGDLDCRTVSLCSTPEEAFQLVEGNYGDIYEEGYYPLVVIEQVVLDEVYGGCEAPLRWYRWEGDEYKPCECPEPYANIISFWQ